MELVTQIKPADVQQPWQAVPLNVAVGGEVIKVGHGRENRELPAQE
jgi:hypothetical protein